MATIYFATNRKSDDNDHPTSFGEGFSDVCLGDVRFGRANVVDGNLDLTSIEVLPNTPASGSTALFAELRKSMKTDQRDALLFIHGFNVTFQDAMEAAGRMGDRYCELSGVKYCPNIFVFSWPSDGKMTHYSNDRHDAEVSGYAFARGLMKLSAFLKSCPQGEACNQKINLLAHSMGNYVLRNALQQIPKISGAASVGRVFDNVVLAAADEDADAFEYDFKLSTLPNYCQRITVYFNNNDPALKISEDTKGNPDRLGHDGPARPRQVPAKVVSVDVTDTVPGILPDVGHSYYQNVDKVAKDIVAILQGEASDSKNLSREYVPHANKFRLV